MADALTPVMVVTGAFDCGKTSTLEWLRDHYGIRIHAEAHGTVLAQIGNRTLGHLPDEDFVPIDDPRHFCPMCRPLEFAEQVLSRQRTIESSAQPGDFFDRGGLDPLEMLLRTTAGTVRAPVWTPVTRYVRVILFEVMPELQKPRWGKTASQRAVEAGVINQRLAEFYVAAGHVPITIPSGSIAERAARVLALLK